MSVDEGHVASSRCQPDYILRLEIDEKDLERLGTDTHEHNGNTTEAIYLGVGIVAGAGDLNREKTRRFRGEI
jgi:hypothetical protein